MKGLTLTIITQKATSLNYGESIGNVSVLKKLTMADNSQYTYISDKALKYDMKRLGRDMFGWNLLDQLLIQHITGSLNSKSKLDTEKFTKEIIEKYQEFDLFGGLFTNIKNPKSGKKLDLSQGDSVKRTSVVKVSYGFSISPFKSDMDFMNNIDAYNRYIKYIEDKGNQSIANSEQHKSHYVYTITVDLDRVGRLEKESDFEDALNPKAKAERITQLLDIIKLLNRQIRGRWENLSPIFVIGGVFSVKNPFFLDCVKAIETNDLIHLNLNTLKEAIKLVPKGEEVVCGIMPGFFFQEETLKKELSTVGISEAFEILKGAVENAYGT